MTNALAWTLIPFLWEGALIALALAAALGFSRQARLRDAAPCASNVNIEFVDPSGAGEHHMTSDPSEKKHCSGPAHARAGWARSTGAGPSRSSAGGLGICYPQPSFRSGGKGGDAPGGP